MARKGTTSFRISPEAHEMLKALADKLAVTQAAVLELSIRKYAELENIAMNIRKPDNIHVEFKSLCGVGEH